MNEIRPLVDIKELRQLIAFHYEDINENILDYYLTVAAIKFARKSKSIKRKIEIQAQDKLDKYTLPDIPYHQIFELESVQIDNLKLKPASNTCPCSFEEFNYSSNVINICNPDKCIIKIIAIVVPKRSECKIDEDIYNLWGEIIANGANAILMKSNHSKWSNKSMAGHEESSFLMGCEDALEHAQRNGVIDEIYNDDKRAKAITSNRYNPNRNR